MITQLMAAQQVAADSSEHVCSPADSSCAAHAGKASAMLQVQSNRVDGGDPADSMLEKDEDLADAPRGGSGSPGGGGSGSPGGGGSGRPGGAPSGGSGKSWWRRIRKTR